MTSKGFGNVEAHGNWELQLVGDASTSISNEEVFMLGLRATLDLLYNANKTVVFIFDVPELGFHPKQCVFDRYYIPNKRARVPCSVPLSDYRLRNDSFKESISGILNDYPNVKSIDLSRALCDNDSCWAAKGERLLYMDDDHLSDFGAKYVVGILEQNFRNLYD